MDCPRFDEFCLPAFTAGHRDDDWPGETRLIGDPGLYAGLGKAQIGGDIVLIPQGIGLHQMQVGDDFIQFRSSHEPVSLKRDF